MPLSTGPDIAIAADGNNKTFVQAGHNATNTKKIFKIENGSLSVWTPTGIPQMTGYEPRKKYYYNMLQPLDLGTDVVDGTPGTGFPFVLA